VSTVRGNQHRREERVKVDAMPAKNAQNVDMALRTPHRLSPVAGAAVGLALVGLAVLVTLPFRDDITVATPALVLTLPGSLAGIVAGRRAAIVTAVAAAVAFNLVFLQPYGTLKVAVVDDVVALVVLTAVALTVSTLVAREADRRRAAEVRADELAKLYRENEKMREGLTRLQVLEEVDAQRQALLRSVSHDLRTPLASIRAAASELREGAPHDEDARAELLALVGDEAERLDRLVANLLNLSRIEAGVLRPQRQAIALDELVAERVRKLSRLFTEVRVQVDVPADLPYADADYTLLDQVVSNLLENAARHSPARSTVWISARPAGEFIEVSVTDEGRGITGPERVQLFEPFRAGPGSASSGIGLAICKAIVEAHGGTIDAAGVPGKGARFTFTVPARPAEATAEPSEDRRLVSGVRRMGPPPVTSTDRGGAGG
jgi:K+-sensing histidine kinase KdpD